MPLVVMVVLMVKLGEMVTKPSPVLVAPLSVAVDGKEPPPPPSCHGPDPELAPPIPPPD